jgi:sodium/potassium-transporting ATPase subunit alpha
MQLEALRQAQSAFYLSILIVQLWNLFVCKTRLRLPTNKNFFVSNRSTWIAVACGTLFALLVVYTPVTNGTYMIPTPSNYIHY